MAGMDVRAAAEGPGHLAERAAASGADHRRHRPEASVLPMPALQRESRPLELTGRVRLISDGRFRTTIAMGRGLITNMGTTAVLSVGSADIMVVSRHFEPVDPGCFRSVGIEPTARRHLMLKSRIHYRVGFRDLVREVVECAGLGVCTSDYSEITFENVRRPTYPLDRVDTRMAL